MHRDNVKVVDCTIRDGGLMNDSNFDIETVRAVYKACCEANIDVCELGYRNSKEMFDPAEFGPWRFCDEEDLRKATDGIGPGRTKVAVMMDAHKSNPDDLLPASESVVDIVRVATYTKDINQAVRTCNAATELGYETTINIMAITHVHMPDVEACLDQAEEETQASAVYIVDSFGYMYMDQLHYMVAKYQMHLKTKDVGVHFHNNQQLAFANTMEGIVNGATWADGTMNGLGRGAGNCTTELLMSFLKNPDLDILPVLDCIGKYITPLKKDIEWGYHIPYFITGILNQHPQSAIRQMSIEDEAEKHDYVTFYTMVDE
ncbi:MAG: nucleoid-structuring protein H-NS [Planctomycetes bacterium]|jgi:4-hydroxy 2-oxovalerate aldolase|nr:aldolase catalytic domain-containing protein [Phycisphaerae bacterium]NBB94429.1 nucleoid-structuring protein H-NS [Planctomycetota bacterium]